MKRIVMQENPGLAPPQPEAKSEYDFIRERLRQSLGLEYAAMFSRGSSLKNASERSIDKDEGEFAELELERDLGRALEKEREGGTPLSRHRDFTDRAIAELNALTPESVTRAESHALKKLEELPEELREKVREAIVVYFGFIRRVIGVRDEKDGTFFLMSKRLLNNEFKDEGDIDLRRRVTVSAFTSVVWPMLDVLSENETERLRGFYRQKAQETHDLLMQICPDLPATEMEGRLRNLKFRVVGIMAEKPERWERVGGSYNGQGRIVLTFGMRETAGTVVHEALHGLSDNGEVDGFEDGRFGDDVNRMLTEAVVEELSDFSEGRTKEGEEGNEVYLRARQALAWLRRSFHLGESHEIPLDVFVEALFKPEPLMDVLARRGISGSDCDKFIQRAKELFAAKILKPEKRVEN